SGRQLPWPYGSTACRHATIARRAIACRIGNAQVLNGGGKQGGSGESPCKKEQPKNMDPQPMVRPEELWWANPQLKQQLLTDPAGVLKDRGLNVPPDFPLPVVHEFVRVAHLLWVEGKILPLDQFYIDPADEGLLFGRGAWESTRTVGGVPWLWPLHLDRLRHT